MKSDGPFICANCGQEWATDPMLTVPCPKCHAGVGVRCSAQRPSGHRVKLGTGTHVEREQAAMDAGFLEKCPGLPPDTAAALEPVSPRRPTQRPPMPAQAALWPN